MDYNEVTFFLFVIVLSLRDRLTAAFTAGFAAQVYPENAISYSLAVVLSALVVEHFAFLHSGRAVNFATDDAPIHLCTDTIRALAARYPVLTPLFLCVFSFPRSEVSGAGATLSEKTYRLTLFSGTLLGVVFGFILGYVAGVSLRSTSSPPALLEALGVMFVSWIGATTVRLLWARLSHRWRKHESSVG